MDKGALIRPELLIFRQNRPFFLGKRPLSRAIFDKRLKEEDNKRVELVLPRVRGRNRWYEWKLVRRSERVE
jgi:hypothetical protein